MLSKSQGEAEEPGTHAGEGAATGGVAGALIGIGIPKKGESIPDLLQ